VIDAVVFDLDGLLVDSEHLWDEVREALVRERGGRWHERAQADMMGMSSPEWSRYMHEQLGLEESPDEIAAEVVRGMEAIYRERLPCCPEPAKRSSASRHAGRSALRRRRTGR
jgi:beta-phosphoglucomutase-like phosphatase (HAD superfamily)